MKCPNCGMELAEGKLYCEQCGEDIHIVPDFEPEVESTMAESLGHVFENAFIKPKDNAPKMRIFAGDRRDLPHPRTCADGQDREGDRLIYKMLLLGEERTFLRLGRAYALCCALEHTAFAFRHRLARVPRENSCADREKGALLNGSIYGIFRACGTQGAR